MPATAENHRNSYFLDSLLEFIGTILSHASPPERQALREATERAISQESASSAPREDWLAAYHAIVESYLQ